MAEFDKIRYKAVERETLVSGKSSELRETRRCNF